MGDAQMLLEAGGSGHAQDAGTDLRCACSAGLRTLAAEDQEHPSNLAYRACRLVARTNLQLKETGRYTAVSDHERHKKAINAAERILSFIALSAT